MSIPRNIFDPSKGPNRKSATKDNCSLCILGISRAGGILKVLKSYQMWALNGLTPWHRHLKRIFKSFKIWVPQGFCNPPFEKIQKVRCSGPGDFHGFSLRTPCLQFRSAGLTTCSLCLPVGGTGERRSRSFRFFHRWGNRASTARGWTRIFDSTSWRSLFRPGTDI